MKSIYRKWIWRGGIFVVLCIFLNAGKYIFMQEEVSKVLKKQNLTFGAGQELAPLAGISNVHFFPLHLLYPDIFSRPKLEIKRLKLTFPFYRWDTVEFEIESFRRQIRPQQDVIFSALTGTFTKGKRKLTYQTQGAFKTEGTAVQFTADNFHLEGQHTVSEKSGDFVLNLKGFRLKKESVTSTPLQMRIEGNFQGDSLNTFNFNGQLVIANLTPLINFLTESKIVKPLQATILKMGVNLVGKTDKMIVIPIKISKQSLYLGMVKLFDLPRVSALEKEGLFL